MAERNILLSQHGEAMRAFMSNKAASISRFPLYAHSGFIFLSLCYAPVKETEGMG
jgi:hypothetical protein